MIVLHENNMEDVEDNEDVNLNVTNIVLIHKG